ncbi:EAL domain-containing protein [Bacillus coagulans]|uniref:putative bifunctional diguanylate cyclase/phosphodiesterase n=1 Tax=Heyndrickxia coagulans TaxID=1398 RepID=UPI001378180F|nr:EAL domain-containing protein [Heyndrickxia coagulans]NCG67335.1 EAL domain-containing protein [Heyndrickxia coagulans]
MDNSKAEGQTKKLQELPIDIFFSRDFLSKLSETVSVLKVENGPTFKFVYVNKQEEQTEKAGKFLHDVLEEREAARFEYFCQTALEDNKAVDFIHHSGARRILHTSLAGMDGGEWMIAITRDVTELLDGGRMLPDAHTYQFDPLTGLWNRHALLDRLNRKTAEAKRGAPHPAVLYIDLDRLKYFNDILGQHVGDEILKRTAIRLKQLPFPDNEVYRQGGDEFIVLTTGRSREDVKQMAEQILALFYDPFKIEGEDYFLSPSVGISLFPEDGEDGETLIKHADTALFKVKEGGKGHFLFYSKKMDADFHNYILMEAHLRRAVEKNELAVHYQPQVQLDTGKIKSFEALLRWRNPKFGNVPPLKFIPLAEETGLITSIGAWVIDHVCAQIAQWRQKGWTGFRIAVNISPKQFLDPGLAGFIGRTLEKYKLPASVLEIEITEGAMQDENHILKVLSSLKDMGLTISVDDFGTGYSSLNYLKKLPVDILKIDQSFVRELENSQKDAAITRTIIHLAHQLGLEVVAEGVEEQGQVKFLQSARCQKAQGYFFSRPVPAEEVEKQLFV